MGSEVIVAGRVRVYFVPNYKVDPPLELLKSGGLTNIDPNSTTLAKNSLPGSTGVADNGSPNSALPTTANERWQVLGNDYISEEGVSQNFSETQEDVMIQASNLPIKTYRTVEDKQISMTVYDMSAKTFSLLNNNNPISALNKASGNNPTIDMDSEMVILEQGVDVDYIGLIVEGNSPAGKAERPTELMYFYYPRVAVLEMGEFSLTKTATGMPITFKLYEDDQSIARAANSPVNDRGIDVWQKFSSNPVVGRFVSTKNVRQAFKLDQKVTS